MADTRKREYLRRVRNKHSVARGLASGFLKMWDRDYFLNSVREANFSSGLPTKMGPGLRGDEPIPDYMLPSF